MKKISGIILVGILSIILLYFIQPLFGLNIQLSEFTSRYFGFLLSGSSAVSLPYSTKPGLKIYAKDLDAPRFMRVIANGDLLVAEPKKGQIILIPYQRPEEKKVLLEGLQRPHSMDIYNNYLYIAEESAIGRIRFNEQKGSVQGVYQRVISNLPADGGHWTRTIKFGPDGFAYVSVGSSCNVCIEKNDLRAAISRFKPEEFILKVYAQGLRNSVGFDWSLDGVLYATENGRDFLGDHLPPEELNRIEENSSYGWPYAYGDRVPDPEFGKGNQSKVQNSKPPVFEFPAHVAPLGISFIKNPHSAFYEKALVAWHGSWNSSRKVGYKVVSLNFTKGTVHQEILVDFLVKGKVLGRPVHVVEGKAGEIYISDDMNGVIYQL